MTKKNYDLLDTNQYCDNPVYFNKVKWWPVPI